MKTNKIKFLTFFLSLVCMFSFGMSAFASESDQITRAPAPYQDGGIGSASYLVDNKTNKVNLHVDCMVYPGSHVDLNSYWYSTTTSAGCSFSALGSPSAYRDSGTRTTIYTGSGTLWKNGSYVVTLSPSVSIKY